MEQITWVNFNNPNVQSAGKRYLLSPISVCPTAYTSGHSSRLSPTLMLYDVAKATIVNLPLKNLLLGDSKLFSYHNVGETEPGSKSQE